MNKKDKELLVKKNKLMKIKLLIITNVIFSLIIFLVFSLSIRKTVNNNYSIKPMKASINIQDKLNEIKDINHIEDVYESREKEARVNTISLDNQQLKGEINLVGTTIDKINEISNNNYENKYSIACPRLFMSNYNGDIIPFTPRNRLTNMNKFINKNLNVEIFNSSKIKDNISLKIVGTFKNLEDTNTYSECYASHELIKEIFDYQMNGYNESNKDYKAYQIVIDDVTNYEKVRENLENLGIYIFDSKREYNDNASLKTRIYVSLIIFFLEIIILISILIKDNKRKENQTIIYKTMGMKKIDIKELSSMRIKYIYIDIMKKSILTTLIIFAIIFIILYYYPFSLGEYILKPNVLSLIIYYLIFTIFFLLTNKVGESIEKSKH